MPEGSFKTDLTNQFPSLSTEFESEHLELLTCLECLSVFLCFDFDLPIINAFLYIHVSNHAFFICLKCACPFFASYLYSFFRTWENFSDNHTQHQQGTPSCSSSIFYYITYSCIVIVTSF